MNNVPPTQHTAQSRRETRAFYNKISHYYDLLSEWSEDSLRREGLKQLKISTGERVLEIGFGTGHVLVLMATAVGSFGEVYGVDLSEEMVRIAARNVKLNAVADRLHLICGDASAVPLGGNILDCIFMSFTLELFDNNEIPQVLAECLRLLRKGGRLLVISMSKETEHETVVEALEWTHKHFPKVLDCHPIFVRRAVEDAGFEIKNVIREMIWVPVEIVLAVKKKW